VEQLRDKFQMLPSDIQKELREYLPHSVTALRSHYEGVYKDIRSELSGFLNECGKCRTATDTQLVKNALHYTWTDRQGTHRDASLSELPPHQPSQHVNCLLARITERGTAWLRNRWDHLLPLRFGNYPQNSTVEDIILGVYSQRSTVVYDNSEVLDLLQSMNYAFSDAAIRRLWSMDSWVSSIFDAGRMCTYLCRARAKRCTSARALQIIDFYDLQRHVQDEMEHVANLQDKFEAEAVQNPELLQVSKMEPFHAAYTDAWSFLATLLKKRPRDRSSSSSSSKKQRTDACSLKRVTTALARQCK
jgi:hypothetical protein